MGIDKSLHPFPFIHYVELKSSGLAYFYSEHAGDVMKPDNIRMWAQGIIKGDLEPINYVLEAQQNQTKTKKTDKQIQKELETSKATKGIEDAL